MENETSGGVTRRSPAAVEEAVKLEIHLFLVGSTPHLLLSVALHGGPIGGGGGGSGGGACGIRICQIEGQSRSE
ncbi:hypothetical protein SLEP1_g21533 [Rubroshorea leprosula]|uniref:Uncharacterized protein n=1 Tax=Rubroshorea leprosula TaxID=152421 RepID=A0AAV5JCB0_9ROSI|nr:hypothetical protein SLEP1_g21533 [Rubroshorea leprosula]